MPPPALSVSDLTHPHYERLLREWFKWRLCYEGGQRFIDFYLQQWSKRETIPDFMARKLISYAPAFAKAAINEVKNSIFQRMVDVTRIGGSTTYQNAVDGLDNGVDLLGSSMNSFIGRKILPELLTMSKIGVFVDMPNVTMPTLADQTIAQKRNLRPYIYYYPAEDIRSWIYDDTEDPNEFSSILLRDYYYDYEPETKLPTTQKMRFRHLWKEDGKVYAKFYTETGQVVDQRGNLIDEPILLDIPNIPFVVFELSDSLLHDIANYQIALLNMESGDLMYSLRANFPFYTEQFDPRAENNFFRPPDKDQGGTPGLSADAQAAKPQEIITGPQQGRKYPTGTERPGFIHPSPDPLRVSMEKGMRMREDIRQLLNLAITNLQAKMASAESKGFDERSLESGLSYIGLELENGERKIAKFWAAYENTRNPQQATVNYPEKYTLRSEEDRRKDADQLEKLMPSIPSITFRKEVSKQIVDLTLGVRVSRETLDKINKEIDGAKQIDTDWQAIASDVQNGLVSNDTASQARGYPAGEAVKAAKDHADRLKRIQEAQTSPSENQPASPAARGLADQGGNGDGKKEKEPSREAATSDTGKRGVRGAGQSPPQPEG
jgi:hypothetical protein